MSYTGQDNVVSQVKLNNPASKSLAYRIMIAGRDARDFCVLDRHTESLLPKHTDSVTGKQTESKTGKQTESKSSKQMESVTLGPRSSVVLTVRFTGRFVRGAEGVMVVVGRRQRAGVGSTLVFTLRTSVDNIVPKVQWYHCVWVLPMDFWFVNCFLLIWCFTARDSELSNNLKTLCLILQFTFCTVSYYIISYYITVSLAVSFG